MKREVAAAVLDDPERLAQLAFINNAIDAAQAELATNRPAVLALQQ